MSRVEREASAPTGCERILLFCHVVFYRGLQRLGGGAQRERLGRGKESDSGSRASLPDLLHDFFQ